MNAGKSRIIAGGMLRSNTPVEHYPEYGLYVKREDKSCPPPGPPFSKARGVYAHIAKLPAHVQKVGVLDTAHSQAGHAVARACQVLGKQCWNYFPVYKAERERRDPLRPAQEKASDLGAVLVSMDAGRSCILYHKARRETEEDGGYMMPNALKLPESVEETAKEVPQWPFANVIIPASSATIAAGVIRGFAAFGTIPRFIVHLGYSRSHSEVHRYLEEASGVALEGLEWVLIDEGYSYKDKARPGPTPPWPCNAYYDLKAFRWWMREGRAKYGAGIGIGRGLSTLFWNVG